MAASRDTQGPEYTDELLAKQMAWWKRILDVQAPYRWNLRRLNPGFTSASLCLRFTTHKNRVMVFKKK